MNRREFLQTGSGVVSGMLLLNPRAVFGYEANSAVRHGLLGCGNRGTSVATSFAKNTSARVVALADLFPDNLAAGQDHFNKLNARLGQLPDPDSKCCSSRARVPMNNSPTSPGYRPYPDLNTAVLPRSAS